MNWRRWFLVLHRDMGYFFTGALLLYAVSGLAVNHVDHWNPNFIVERKKINLNLPHERSLITEDAIRANLEPLGEADNLRGFDFPTDSRIKIYLKEGSIEARLASSEGDYESIRRRPILYQANALHLNPADWWIVFSDIFAVSLIVIAATGLFIARGRHGLGGRGKWFVGAGVILPLVAMLVF